MFALISSDTSAINSMVSGTLLICTHPTYVLIDSGSTHSFVSIEFASKFTRHLESLGCILSVSIPCRGSMICSMVYKACDILVGNAILSIDLIPLGLSHFDAILGMDWLTSNCATIDFMFKTILFHIPNQPEFSFEGKGVFPPPYLLSSTQACCLLKKVVKGSCVALLKRNLRIYS